VDGDYSFVQVVKENNTALSLRSCDKAGLLPWQKCDDKPAKPSPEDPGTVSQQARDSQRAEHCGLIAHRRRS
jgi:hypothetical protein